MKGKSRKRLLELIALEISTGSPVASRLKPKEQQEGALQASGLPPQPGKGSHRQPGESPSFSIDSRDSRFRARAEDGVWAAGELLTISTDLPAHAPPLSARGVTLPHGGGHPRLGKAARLCCPARARAPPLLSHTRGRSLVLLSLCPAPAPSPSL